MPPAGFPASAADLESLLRENGVFDDSASEDKERVAKEREDRAVCALEKAMGNSHKVQVLSVKRFIFAVSLHGPLDEFYQSVLRELSVTDPYMEFVNARCSSGVAWKCEVRSLSSSRTSFILWASLEHMARFQFRHPGEGDPVLLAMSLSDLDGGTNTAAADLAKRHLLFLGPSGGGKSAALALTPLMLEQAKTGQKGKGLGLLLSRQDIAALLQKEYGDQALLQGKTWDELLEEPLTQTPHEWATRLRDAIFSVLRDWLLTDFLPGWPPAEHFGLVLGFDEVTPKDASILRHVANVAPRLVQALQPVHKCLWVQMAAAGTGAMGAIIDIKGGSLPPALHYVDMGSRKGWMELMDAQLGTDSITRSELKAESEALFAMATNPRCCAIMANYLRRGIVQRSVGGWHKALLHRVCESYMNANGIARIQAGGDGRAKFERLQGIVWSAMLSVPRSDQSTQAAATSMARASSERPKMHLPGLRNPGDYSLAVSEGGLVVDLMSCEAVDNSPQWRVMPSQAAGVVVWHSAEKGVANRFYVPLYAQVLVVWLRQKALSETTAQPSFDQALIPRPDGDGFELFGMACVSGALLAARLSTEATLHHVVFDLLRAKMYPARDAQGKSELLAWIQDVLRTLTVDPTLCSMLCECTVRPDKAQVDGALKRLICHRHGRGEPPKAKDAPVAKDSNMSPGTFGVPAVVCWRNAPDAPYADAGITVVGSRKFGLVKHELWNRRYPRNRNLATDDRTFPLIATLLLQFKKYETADQCLDARTYTKCMRQCHQNACVSPQLEILGLPVFCFVTLQPWTDPPAPKEISSAGGPEASEGHTHETLPSLCVHLADSPALLNLFDMFATAQPSPQTGAVVKPYTQLVPPLSTANTCRA